MAARNTPKERVWELPEIDVKFPKVKLIFGNFFVCKEC